MDPKSRDRLRAAIRAAHDAGRGEELVGLRAEYRALPTESRQRDVRMAMRAAGSPLPATYAGPEVRARILAAREAKPEASKTGETLYGHFAVFDVWTEVDSFWEGLFMERIAPGAFRATLKDDRQRITFNHGRDATMGNQILARVPNAREDDLGAYYEAELLAGVPSLLIEGLRAGVYGASFRFFVMSEEFKEKPGKSDHNPFGIPERTITEAEVDEFGPVSFPQYPEATAQLRSLSVHTTANAGPSAPVRAAIPQISDDEWSRRIRGGRN